MTTASSVTPLVDRAIIPAAGFGTRLRPLSRAIPKEMLPLGRKPVLEYVVDELRQAGIQRALMVVSPGKEMIRGYFGDGSAFGLCIEYAMQCEMRGLGDAVLHGEEWAEGRDFAVAFGDCIIEAAGAPPLRRLMEVHAGQSSVATVLCERIALERSSRYGILKAAGEVGEAFPLAGIVEKPRPEDAPSEFAVAARWALSAAVFEHIRACQARTEGEVGLTEPVCAMIAAGMPAWAVRAREGEARLDIGGWDTYLIAAALAAVADAEHGAAVRTAICEEAA